MDDDFFIIEPTKDELRQYRARVCTKCHRMLHPKQFRRPLTWAQARSRGYKGDRVMYVEGTMCKACSPATFRPSKMTKGEIEQAAANGRVSYARARIEIEKKQLRAAEHARTLVSHRWEERERTSWQRLLDLLQAEARHVRRELPGTAALLLANREALRVATARVRLSIKRADPYPANLSWGDLVGAKAHARLMAFYHEAHALTLRWKHPLLLVRALPVLTTNPKV